MATCSRCGLRSAALQVAGAFDCASPEELGLVAEECPLLFETCQALAQEVQTDESHDEHEA